MANTTNFGWETPDDTDLVKDGAAAIRTLGSAIDTSLGDLEGGTTGQILAKNSNTDMDFVWITNDVGDITEVVASTPLTGGGSSGSITVGIQDGTTAQKGAVQLEDSTSSTSTTKASTPNSVKSAYDLANAAIPKSLVDAAGDLIYATADNTPARLAIGTAGQILKVNSGATAPEWGTVSSAAMTLIQRSSFSNVAGTSTTFDGVFSSTYKNYRITIENLSAATAADDLHLQLRYAGPTTQTATYYGNYSRNNQGATDTTVVGQENLAQFTCAESIGTTNGNSGTIYFYGLTSSQRTVFSGTYQDTNAGFYTNFGGFNSTARDYTGFLLKSSSTNITGTVAVYGMA